MASDAHRAEQVPREELGLAPAAPLSVNYVDGEVDLPSGPRAVRVFYRAGLGIPHNLYLATLEPENVDAHRRALAAVVADSTALYRPQTGQMTVIEKVCAKKGAFDPGGERAWPTESLGSIGRLAADRELYRRFRQNA